MRKHLKYFFNNQSGATAIEYALIASLIAVAIVIAVSGLGSEVGNSFNATANAVGG